MTNDEKVYGIVIRFADYKEYHKMLTIFTPKYGMVSALSPASKRPKSALRAGSEMFVFGNFSFKVKAQRATLSEVEIIDSFYDLRTNIEALSLAYYMRDFCEYASQAEQDMPEIFSLLIKCLTMVCHSKMDARLVRYAFELKMMEILGLNVILDRCIECSKDNAKSLFNIQEGGVVCEGCKSKHFSTIEVSPQAINVLKLISELPIEKLSVIKLNEKTKQEIDSFWSQYLKWHLDKNFKSADFMEKSRDF